MAQWQQPLEYAANELVNTKNTNYKTYLQFNHCACTGDKSGRHGAKSKCITKKLEELEELANITKFLLACL